MKFYSLSSSSQGNCYYLESGDSALLIDAGIAAKKIEATLAQSAANPAKLKGILLTHEHIDHVRSVGTLAKKYHLPIFATEGTWQGLEQMNCSVPFQLRRSLDELNNLTLGRFNINWQATVHDCFNPIFFSINDGEKKFGLITDTGELNSQMTEMLYDSYILIAEANHDVNMLKSGSYPFRVKQRILSSHGHLSNEDCAQGLLAMIGSHTKHIMLAHLSQHNNTPLLAYKTVKQTLEQNCTYEDYTLWVARAEARSSILEV